MEQFKTKNKISIHLLAVIVVLTSLPLFDGGFDHSIVYWMTITMLLVLFYDNLKYKKDKIIGLNYPFIFYLLFLVWSFISLLWTVNHVRTVIEFIQILCYGLVYLIVRKLDSDDLLKLGKFVIFTGICITALALVEYIFVKSSRLAGTFTNPNPFGIFIVMLFLITLGYELNKPSTLGKFISIIFLSTLILSGSRGSFLSLMIAITILFVNTDKKDLLRKTFKIVFIFMISFLLSKGLMIIASVVQNTFIDPTLSSSFVRIDSFIPTSVIGRLEFWKVAGRLMLNQPVKGYGLGTYFAAYYLEYGNNIWYARFTHNHYLQTIVELGVIGFSFLIAFFSITLLNMYKLIKNNNYPFYFAGLFSAILAFLIHIGMDFSWNFPAVTALFFAVVSVVNNERNFQKRRDLKIRPIYRKILIVTLCLFILWHVGAQHLYMYGLNLSKEGNHSKSNEIYEIANRVYPVSGIGHSLSSQNYYELYKIENDSEHLEKAIISARESIKLLPIDGDQHNKLGQLYLESGDFLKAEKHLKLGVEYGAYGINRSIDLASLYIQNDEDKEAEEVMINALKLQPYALKRANKENKDRVIVETLKIRLMLKKIYTERGNKEYATKQNEFIVKLIEEHPFLIMYFN